ncbi:hypothetical protein [Bdellovibrio sp. HCB209]|uniref:hypothetical protein n=1 Tax=Bdellovibrio sp. HCB209 TaxID=3394354 RepID=UPI0039B6C7FE
MATYLTVFRLKFVIVLLFCVVGAPCLSMAQMSAPGGFTSDGRRLADLDLADLRVEVSLGDKADNRVLKNLLWSVKRNGTSADVAGLDSLYQQFKLASENGLSRVHDSIRAEYSPEVLEFLWQETRNTLISRRSNSCAKIF